MSQSTNTTRGDLSPNAPQDAQYPPQLHAGAVGLGPEFGKGASINDKFNGLKQEIKGKVKHDPNLVEQGRDLRTGELKRKEMREDLGVFSQSGQAHSDQEKHKEGCAGQERPDIKTVEHPGDKE